MFHLNPCGKLLSFMVRILVKSYCHSLQFLQMYFDWWLSCQCNNSRPSANTAAYLPGLHNHLSATDPQTVYFSGLKFPWVLFLPLPSNSCVLHLLDYAKQFKIWTDEGLKTKWFEIYCQSWAMVAYRLLFGKKNPHSHALVLAPFPLCSLSFSLS